MPRRVDHDLRRQEIGEALLRIAASRGLEAASMREVAAEAGVSLRLVQYYFHTKNELLRAGLGYLGEHLAARVERHLGALKSRTPRAMLYATLTAILPTDPESRWLRRTYFAYYALGLDIAQASEAGATYPDVLERLLADHVRASQEAGDVDAELDATTVGAGLLALTNGLGASVLGGQRDGDAARAILTYHLERLFRA
jgi:AcrR family transcriptional regulator